MKQTSRIVGMASCDGWHITFEGSRYQRRIVALALVASPGGPARVEPLVMDDHGVIVLASALGTAKHIGHIVDLKVIGRPL